ncbi:MAG: HD domain-containing protein [Firmicutes bacterium]|nr:HD domain-containing protein [Bacillota bacterium]
MNITSIYEYIEKNLSEKRKVHTEGVRQTAIKLAERYGCDVDKAELAALCHDLYRNLSKETANDYVRQMGLPERYLDNINLSHGKIAAWIMKRDMGIEDEDVLNAVEFHTTGRYGMSLLEKILYIADGIEPGRDYPGVDELRKLAFQDLDATCLLALNHSVAFVQSKGEYLDQDTMYAKAYFEERIEKKE